MVMGLMLLASAFTGCSQDNTTTLSDGQKKTVTLQAAYVPFADETRTSFDAATGKVAWAAGDQLTVFIAEAGTEPTQWENLKFTVSDPEQGIFQGEAELDPAKSYDWYVMSPYNFYTKNPLGTDGSFQLGNQTLKEGVADNLSAADCMYGVALNVKGDAMPNVSLKHLGTLMKFTIVNTEDVDVVPSRIEFEAPSGTYLGGRALINFKTGEYTLDSKWNSTTLTINNGEAIGAGSSLDYYMVMLPFALESNDEFTISITTDKGICTQTRTMTEALSFESGLMNTATVNFTLPEVEEATYTLVTDLSALTAGSEVLIVSRPSAGDQALSTLDGNFYAGVGVTITDNMIVNPASVGVLTVGVDGSNYTLNDGTGYLIAVNGENYLKREDAVTDASRWTITIDETDNSATIRNVAYSNYSIKYNASSPRFSCYKDTSKQTAVYLYKKN